MPSGLALCSQAFCQVSGPSWSGGMARVLPAVALGRILRGICSETMVELLRGHYNLPKAPKVSSANFVNFPEAEPSLQPDMILKSSGMLACISTEPFLEFLLVGDVSTF